MKYSFKIIALTGLLALGAGLTSCNKTFDQLTLNENLPNSVPAALLLTGIETDAFEGPNGQGEILGQYYLNNYDYYGNNRYDLGGAPAYYTTLKNVGLMEKQAAAAGSPAVNAYSALGKFFRAYLLTRMSLAVGDIPASQALLGLDNLTPAYDTQKQVFVQAFASLESANADLTALIAGGTTTVDGDIYFSGKTGTVGDLRQWQKVVNTLRVRLLLHLSKKTADADLSVIPQFAAILGNPAKYPLMSSSADNMQYVYYPPANLYPNNDLNFGQDGSRKNMAAAYVGLLTSLKDPRVFITCEPARDQVDKQGQLPTDFASFVGAGAGEDLGLMYNNAGLQKYSFLNRRRYFSTSSGEPSVQIGFPELAFNLAEGINRGWASGSAETYYTAGIQASWASYGLPSTGPGTYTAAFYRPGSTSVTNTNNYDNYAVPVNFATYYAQPTVKYAAGGGGLTQVQQQKYLALFRHSGYESFYTQRRTGVPTFNTGPGTGNSSRIALRFQYPASERTANTANYQAALQSQYGGNDDINGVMYILK